MCTEQEIGVVQHRQGHLRRHVEFDLKMMNIASTLCLKRVVFWAYN